MEPESQRVEVGVGSAYPLRPPAPRAITADVAFRGFNRSPGFEACVVVLESIQVLMLRVPCCWRTVSVKQG